MTDSCQTSVARLAWFVEETRNPKFCVSLARCFSAHLLSGDRGIIRTSTGSLGVREGGLRHLSHVFMELVCDLKVYSVPIPLGQSLPVSTPSSQWQRSRGVGRLR